MDLDIAKRRILKSYGLADDAPCEIDSEVSGDDGRLLFAQVRNGRDLQKAIEGKEVLRVRIDSKDRLAVSVFTNILTRNYSEFARPLVGPEVGERNVVELMAKLLVVCGEQFTSPSGILLAMVSFLREARPLKNLDYVWQITKKLIPTRFVYVLFVCSNVVFNFLSKFCLDLIACNI